MNYLPAIDKFLQENAHLPPGQRSLLRQIYSHPLIVNQYLVINPEQDIFRSIPILNKEAPLFLERGEVLKRFHTIEHRKGFIHPDTYKVLQETILALTNTYLPYTSNDEVLVLSLNYIVPTMAPPTPASEQKVNRIINVRHLSPKMDRNFLESAISTRQPNFVIRKGQTFISWNALEHITSNLIHKYSQEHISQIGNLWEEF